MDGSFTIVTVFRSISRGEKRTAAYGTMLYGVFLEQLGFQFLPLLVLQKHMGEELAANGITNALRADSFLSVIQIQTVPIVACAAPAVDEPDSMLFLSGGHARQ